MDGGRTDGDTGASDDNAVEFGPVTRDFQCTACGFATTYEVPRLQAEVQSVCANCGEWTTQVADDQVLAEAAEEAAERLAGHTLTARQALAYLLRDVMRVDRQTTADVMDTSASNVDNLHRKAVEKLEDAQWVLVGLDELGESA